MAAATNMTSAANVTAADVAEATKAAAAAATDVAAATEANVAEAADHHQQLCPLLCWHLLLDKASEGDVAAAEVTSVICSIFRCISV